MALSNIFREPRKEIRESLIGLLVVSWLIVLDLGLAEILCYMADGTTHVPFFELLAAMFVSLLAITVGGVFLVITHSLGEYMISIWRK